jgi:Sel1 repeat
MRARFFIFKAALVLLVSVSGAWPQSYDAAPTQNKGIDPALLSKAQAGDPNAEFDVAYDYQTGQGSPQDLTKAAFWFRKAGDHGHARAQYSLALLYNTGQGVPQDYAEGYFWAELAATGKVEGVRSEVVAKLRDQTASFLTKEVLLQTQERARACRMLRLKNGLRLKPIRFGRWFKRSSCVRQVSMKAPPRPLSMARRTTSPGMSDPQIPSAPLILVILSSLSNQPSSAVRSGVDHHRWDAPRSNVHKSLSFSGTSTTFPPMVST